MDKVRSMSRCRPTALSIEAAYLRPCCSMKETMQQADKSLGQPQLRPMKMQTDLSRNSSFG